MSKNDDYLRHQMSWGVKIQLKNNTQLNEKNFILKVQFTFTAPKNTCHSMLYSSLNL